MHDEDVVRAWRCGEISALDLVRAVKADLLANMNVLTAERANADGLERLRQVLDQQTNNRAHDFGAIFRVANDIYGRALTSRVLNISRPILTASDNSVFLADKSESPAFQLPSTQAVIEYQQSLSQYLEDEEVASPSPLSNYIAGFVNDLPASTRISLAGDLDNLSVFASVPDHLTPEEVSWARLLALRFFGGWSLEQIAIRDGIPLADARFSWHRAREWGASKIQSSGLVNIAFDTLDVQVMRVIARNPELIHALEWRTFERILAVTLEKIGFEVELQRGTKDGGIDVIAIKGDSVFGRHRYLIQAKRWRGKVGVAPVRELLYLRQELGATKACLATTAHFTRGARKLAREHWWELELRDFEQLQEWISQAVASAI